MAIEKRELRRGGCRYRVTYRNPITKELEWRYFGATEYGSPKDAEIAAKQFDLDIKRRIRRDPLSFAGEDARRKTTFGDLAQAYYAAKLGAQEIAPSTVKNDLYRCNTVIFPIIGSVQAEKITEMHMAAIVRAYRDRGCRQNTINRAVSIVKAVFGWARQDGRIQANPVRDYVCKRVREKKNPPPTWDEFWLIHDAAAPHLQRAMILSVALGVRVGSSELLQLRKSETRLARKIMRVWSAKKKQRVAYRDVDLTEWLVAYLTRWILEDEVNSHETDYWVHWRGKRVGTIKTAWKAALERAGIWRRITPYDLRHLHATEALDKGVDIAALAENMGTSPDVIRKHYQHTKRAQRKAAVQAIPDLSKRPPKGNNGGNKAAQ